MEPELPEIFPNLALVTPVERRVGLFAIDPFAHGEVSANHSDGGIGEARDELPDAVGFEYLAHVGQNQYFALAAQDSGVQGSRFSGFGQLQQFNAFGGIAPRDLRRAVRRSIRENADFHQVSRVIEPDDRIQLVAEKAISVMDRDQNRNGFELRRPCYRNAATGRDPAQQQRISYCHVRDSGTA